jgi:poly-gamma-glutamate synthesis protein (capsule biosynthesis protein)
MKPRSPALAAACLFLLAACGRRTISLALVADPGLMPRLESIVARSPLPEGSKVAANAADAEVLISLEPADDGAKGGKGAALCGTEYLAAAAPLAGDLYSTSPGRAEAIGLESLEAIAPPRRALAVDGAWPASPGYPFARGLLLSAGGRRGGAAPGAIVRWVRAAAAAAAAADEAPFTLTAVGDIQVGEAEGPALVGGGIASLLRGGVLEHLRGSDLSIANLESPISSRGAPNPKKRYHFRMPPGSSAALKAAGLGLVLLGNNHALDFGPDAFADTLGDLAGASLPFVGAGKSASEAASAVSVPLRRGGSVACVGYAFFPDETSGFTREDAAAGEDRPGISADLGKALQSVRDAAAAGGFVVVLAHGGTEYQERPSDAAREVYASFVDAGASLVVGTHPHLLQGCEARSGSIIAYSLGNFLFTGEREPPAAWKGAMLDFLVYRGKVRGLRPIPIVAGYDYTRADGDLGAAEARFSRLCAGIEALPPLKAAR